MVTLATKPNFAAIHAAADRAGHAAAKAAEPTPMIVRSGTTGEHWIIPGGVCGFAWVEVKGNTAFGRWAKAAGIAHKGYPSGLSIWVSVGGQSMALKEAYASSYADTLRAYGIEANAASRMD
jgi:hypothetical protein